MFSTVIMAAGLGKRLEPVTSGMSKVMVPVANKPVLEWVFDSAKKVSKDVFIIARKDQKDVIDYFGNRAELIYQDKPMGTGHAIGSCEDFVGNKFILLSGDGLISGEDMKKLSRLDSTTMSTFAVGNPSSFGVVNVENGIVKSIEEKPSNPQTNLVNCGIYVFDDSVFRAIKKTKLSPRGEYEITDSLGMMENVKNFTLSNWVTVTYPWDLLDANAFILDQFGSQISPEADIKDSCIEEPVAIGAASIGPNSYIRKYSSIGNGCKAGNSVEIKNSIIMNGTKVPHFVYMGDSVIGRNCNIACGTVFANLRLDEKTVKMKIKGNVVDSGRKKLGAVVGDNVKFGINVSVMPGKKIFPNIIIPPCVTITKDVEIQPDMKQVGGVL